MHCALLACPDGIGVLYASACTSHCLALNSDLALDGCSHLSTVLLLSPVDGCSHLCTGATEHRPPVDMWATGAILYLLLCGRPPFGDTANLPTLWRNITEGKYDQCEGVGWASVGAHAKDVTVRLLMQDPKLRLTAEQVLAHPWLSEAETAPSNDDGALVDVPTRLRQYNARRRLQQAGRGVIATARLQRQAGALIGGRPLPEQQHMVADALFREISADTTSTVKPVALAELLLERGEDLSRVRVLLARLETDCGDSVSLEAWRRSWQLWMGGASMKEVARAPKGTTEVPTLPESGKEDKESGAVGIPSPDTHLVPTWSPRG